MRRIGLIDIHGFEEKKNRFLLSVYVFKGKQLELEEAEVYPDAVSFLPHTRDDVSEYYISIPVAILNFRILKFPFNDREKIRKIIPLELDSLVVGGSADLLYDLYVLRKVEGSYEVLVCFIKKEILSSVLEELNKVNTTVITSIELSLILSDMREGFSSRLLNSEPLSEDLKIMAAREEIQINTINLRTGSFAESSDSLLKRKSFRLTGILFLFLALMINLSFWFNIFSATKDLSGLKEELRTIYASQFPGEKRIFDELHQMKSHLKALMEKKEILSSVYPLKVMMSISETTVDGVIINEISLDSDIIKLRGEASSIADTDILKNRLLKTFTDVIVTDVSQGATGKNYFTILIKAVKD